MIGMWGEYSALVPYLDRTEEISGDIKQEPKAHLCKLNKSRGRVKKRVSIMHFKLLQAILMKWKMNYPFCILKSKKV